MLSIALGSFCTDTALWEMIHCWQWVNETTVDVSQQWFSNCGTTGGTGASSGVTQGHFDYKHDIFSWEIFFISALVMPLRHTAEHCGLCVAISQVQSANFI